MSIIKKLPFAPPQMPVEWSDEPQFRQPDYSYAPGLRGLAQRLKPATDQQKSNRAAVNAMRHGDAEALRNFLVRADPQRVLKKAFDTRPKHALSPDMQQIAVDLALEHGADPTAVDEKTGESVLHRAARQGRIDVASGMLRHVGNQGSARYGAAAAANFALQSDRAGQSPLDIAGKLKTPEGAQLHHLLQETVEVAATGRKQPPEHQKGKPLPDTPPPRYESLPDTPPPRYESLPDTPPPRYESLPDTPPPYKPPLMAPVRPGRPAQAAPPTSPAPAAPPQSPPPTAPDPMLPERWNELPGRWVD